MADWDEDSVLNGSRRYRFQTQLGRGSGTGCIERGQGYQDAMWLSAEGIAQGIEGDRRRRVEEMGKPGVGERRRWG